MAGTYAVDISGERLDVSISPGLTYAPAMLIIQSKSGTIMIHASDVQLAEIAEAIREHLYTEEKPEDKVCRRL